jgi:hypothetical protein
VTNEPQAVQVARAYYEAWTAKDIDQAMSYIAEDISCDAPPGHIDGAEAFRAFMEPFVQILRGAELLAAFGDDEKAVLVYDTETVPVASTRRGAAGRLRRQDHAQPVRVRHRAVPGCAGGDARRLIAGQIAWPFSCDLDA